MDQISEEVKHARSERAIQAAEELSWEFASRFIGGVREVLLEKTWEQGWEGYTDHYIRTLVEEEKTSGQRMLSENQIVSVRFQNCVRQDGGDILERSDYVMDRNTKYFNVVSDDSNPVRSALTDVYRALQKKDIIL